VRRRGGATAIAASPVLVGVATTLVIVVAIFLAYNANAGLPWVPTYRLTAEVPNGASLVKGNEARIGGLRAGVIDKITPIRNRNGTYAAILDLKLEKRIKPLPVDSTMLIRPRSALGLKYLQITKGHSKTGFAEGSRIPISRYESPRGVDIDIFYSTFDKKTREAAQQNEQGYGAAFAGRGQDINTAIAAFRPLVRNVTAVFRNITAPDARLQDFFRMQERAASMVAPIAQTQADMFVNLDLTFTAFAEVARPFIQESITRGPSGLDTATAVFPKVRPFFRNTAQFFGELKPGTRALRVAARPLADAFTTGVTSVRRSTQLNTRLEGFLRSLQRLAQDPLVPVAVTDLTHTIDALDPTVSTLAPTQTVCNYLGLWFRNLSFLLSEGDSHGTWVRFVPIITPIGPNSESGPSSAPANGGGPDPANALKNYLHANFYPNTAAPGQPRECEAGNEPFAVRKQVIGNTPGSQGTVTDEQKVAKKKKAR
jgi:ABC-type transporter Mla subunit MlaD